MFFTASYQSPLGKITLASDGRALVGLWIAGQKFAPPMVPNNFVNSERLPVLVAARKWLDDYFSGHRPAISRLSLAPVGSPFRQAVWARLIEIPYGETVTYGQVAREVARRMGQATFSSQAVGGAVGHNQISIIIPCHRVIGANGALVGYAGGLDKKIFLLKHEGWACAENWNERRRHPAPNPIRL